MSTRTTRKGFTGRIHRGPMAADVLARDFTQVYNRAVRDRRLSRRARGLLVEILSHREGFGVSEASLVAGGPEGRDAIRTALRELEQYGYLRRRQERDGGQFAEVIFEVTDMPEGLVIGAPPPWEEPTPPPRKSRRSEPLPENPSAVGEDQNRRSEPLPENPATAKPATAKPQHKKNTPVGGSSPYGEEDSLSASHPSDDSPTDAGEREGASPAQNDADAVVDAYVAASVRPVLTHRRTSLHTQALTLLKAGYPVSWLTSRAAEMPERGWVDLITHAERSTVPIPGQQQASSQPSLPPWCGACGDMDQNGEPLMPSIRHNSRWRVVEGVPCSQCHPHALSGA